MLLHKLLYQVIVKWITDVSVICMTDVGSSFEFWIDWDTLSLLQTPKMSVPNDLVPGGEGINATLYYFHLSVIQNIIMALTLEWNSCICTL